MSSFDREKCQLSVELCVQQLKRLSSIAEDLQSKFNDDDSPSTDLRVDQPKRLKEAVSRLVNKFQSLVDEAAQLATTTETIRTNLLDDLSVTEDCLSAIKYDLDMA